MSQQNEEPSISFGEWLASRTLVDVLAIYYGMRAAENGQNAEAWYYFRQAGCVAYSIIGLWYAGLGILLVWLFA